MSLAMPRPSTPRARLLRRIGSVAASYLLAAIALAFFAFPCFWMLTAAFKNPDDAAALPPAWLFTPTIENFRELFYEMDAANALVNSLVVVGISTCLAMIFGSMAAYALARFSIKGKTVLALEILMVRMLPPIVSVIPLYLLAKQLGIFDTYWILIAVYTLAGLPFVVWVMRVFTQDIPRSVEEAALIDGCSRLGVLFRVTMPLLLPGLAATMVIVFMFAWNEFLFASLLTSAKAKTLPVLAAATIKPKAIAWGVASAVGVVMSVPVIVLVLLMQRYLVRGLTFGAVKG